MGGGEWCEREGKRGGRKGRDSEVGKKKGWGRGKDRRRWVSGRERGRKRVRLRDGVEREENREGNSEKEGE